MSHPPRLPPLPPADYRSLPTAPGSSGVRPSNGAPPLPPLPPGALQREQDRIRQASNVPNYNNRPPPAMPQPQLHAPQAHHQPPPPAPPFAFTPGQIITSPPPLPPSGPYGNPSNPLLQPLMRLPSPQPPLGGGGGGGMPHARYHSMQEIHRPTSAASGLSVQPGAPGYAYPGRAGFPAVPAPRHYSIGHSESVPSMAMPGAMPGGNPVPNFGSLSVDAAPMRAPSPAVSGAGYHQATPRRASSSESSRPTGLSAAPASPPALNVPLPDMASLGNMRERALASGNERRKLAWAKQVIKYVERKHDTSKITDPALVRFTDEAISIITRRASSDPPDMEALYMRGDLQATGSFPSYLRKDLKSAFNDFELSARMGWAPSWFRIGRDYEVLNDTKRAMDAYDRGCAVQDVGCLYRRGMSLLLGQLGLRADHAKAIPLLRQAADLADLDTPQPSYIYGMLLAGEFSHVEVPSHLLVPSGADARNPAAAASLETEARRRIERAAYLNFAPAQYKCGWMHEYAQLDCPFDPLLSVQYYSLASQGGEIEADMALSKWFLCGAEGCFEKNEDLAFTFAEKAARKGLGSAEFALAYYYEVGVGCDKDVEYSRKWYKKAAAHGNADAKERLSALEGPAPAVLSRTDHEAHVDGKLVRKRTEAKMLSDRKRRQATAASNANAGAAAPPVPAMPQARPMASNDLSRKRTMRMVEESAGATAATAGGRGRRAGRMSEAGISPASTHPMPIPAPAPQATAAGRHGSGYSLSESYVPQPQARPNAGPSPAKGRMSAGPNGAGRMSVGQPPQSAPTPPSAAASSTASSGSNGSKPAVVYESFHEMGFASKKATEEEKCVIC